jgi:hypothetical protein
MPLKKMDLLNVRIFGKKQTRALAQPRRVGVTSSHLQRQTNSKLSARKTMMTMTRKMEPSLMTNSKLLARKTTRKTTRKILLTSSKTNSFYG